MNIQTMALKFDKIKKSEAQEKLKQLYDIAEDEDKPVIAQLYSYFTPPLPKKCNNMFHWLAKAQCREEVRYHLTQSYCTGDKIVATDGHRLHMIDNNYDHLQGYVGYVDRDGVKIDFYGNFPNVSNVIPNNKDCQVIKISDFEKIQPDDYKYPLGVISFFEGGLEMAFNLSYIQEVFNGDEYATAWVPKHPHSPILLEFDNREAVIGQVKLKS